MSPKIGPGFLSSASSLEDLKGKSEDRQKKKKKGSRDVMQQRIRDFSHSLR
jgi:hypothetical protein